MTIHAGRINRMGTKYDIFVTKYQNLYARGNLFAFCECGVVPITGRLVQKGLPLPVAVSFMLASPVINPVVAASTAAAFNGSWQVAALSSRSLR